NQDNPWRFFEAYLHNQLPRPEPDVPWAASRKATTVTSDEVRAAFSHISQRWSKVRAPTYQSEAMKRLYLEEAPAAPRFTRDDGEAPAAMGGADWGTVIHALFEAAMNRPRDDLRQLARSLLRDLDAGLSWLDDALEVVSKVQKSQVWKRALASQRRFTE